MLKLHFYPKVLHHKINKTKQSTQKEKSIRSPLSRLQVNQSADIAFSTHLPTYYYNCYC